MPPKVTWHSDDELSFGALRERLWKARQDRGLSVADVAERMGVTAAVVNGIENGVTPPSVRQLYAYARAVGVQLRLNLLVLPDRDAEVFDVA